MSVLPNAFGHCVMTSGAVALVPAAKAARYASTAAQGLALRASVHTANTRPPCESDGSNVVTKELPLQAVEA